MLNKKIPSQNIWTKKFPAHDHCQKKNHLRRAEMHNVLRGKLSCMHMLWEKNYSCEKRFKNKLCLFLITQPPNHPTPKQKLKGLPLGKKNVIRQWNIVLICVSVCIENELYVEIITVYKFTHSFVRSFIQNQCSEMRTVEFHYQVLSFQEQYTC